MPEILRFHKSLYDRAGIEAAAEAYSALAEISIGEDGGDYTATVQSHNAEQTEAIVDHFGNHALFASLACHMEGP